jgi:hypothetical protein
VNGQTQHRQKRDRLDIQADVIAERKAGLQPALAEA